MTVRILPTLTLKDQFEQTQTLGPEIRYLIFTAEKDASNLVDEVLEGQTGDTLTAGGIRVVADISAMPGMVTKMFALPKLRKYPYSVLLGRTAEDTRDLPREPGKVTVVEADDGKITARHFMDDIGAMRKVLGLAS